MTKLNVYLNFAGNTEEAFNFYQTVFGGELTNLVRFKEMPMEGITLNKEEENKVMHVNLVIGENVLMGTDALESHGQKLIQGNNVNLSFDPDSKAEADRVFKALAAGGMVEMPLADQVWGTYYGSFIDKFGIRWMVNFDPKKIK